MKSSKILKALLPLVLFIGLAIFLAIGLTKDPRLVPSPFIGKTTPSFNLQRLYKSENISESVFVESKKGFKLLNVWASWCPECWREHGFLMQLSEAGISIIGLNYKDEDEKARAMLAKVGNPFSAVAVDKDGNIGIDYGVYGAPETFVISNEGKILYKHVGGLDANIWKNKVLPIIQNYIKS